MLNNLYPLLLQLPIGTRNPDDNNPIDFTVLSGMIFNITFS